MAIKKKLKWKFEFLWYDFWVGWFWQKKNETLYVCLLPCCVLSVYLSPKIDIPTCPICHDDGTKIAFFTGDGWGLSWDCECGQLQDQIIEWPFGNRAMSAKDLMAHGFKMI